MSRHYPYVFNIYIIGDPGVGKTSLLLRFPEDVFPNSYSPTIGVDFRIRTITLDSKVVKLQIWDISGAVRYQTHCTSCYNRRTDGFVLVYDVTDRESFDHVPLWLPGLSEHSIKLVNLLLDGNKCDLIGERAVDDRAVREYVDRLNMPFIETSAKCNINVEQAFVKIASQIKNSYESQSQIPSDYHNHINLDKKVGERNSRCC